MFSIPLPDVPLPAGGGGENRPDSAPPRFGSLFRQPPLPFRQPQLFWQPPVRIWQPFSTAPARIRQPSSTTSAPLRQPQLFWQPPVRFGSPPRPFWQPPHRIWQSVAGFGRLRTAEQSAGQYVKKRAVPLRGPIGAQRQSARRPCPWRPAGRRGSCRRPWRRRAGRHRRPASNGPLRGPRHRH